MFERFTDRARKVMALANEEAQRLNHEYIGTEHLLLGLVREGEGVAATVLKNLGLHLPSVRAEIVKLISRGVEGVTMGKLPQTPRVKKAIEFAIEEARSLGHNYVGTEHLLLGLLREHDGVGAQVLRNFGMKLDQVRVEVLNVLLRDDPATREALPQPPSPDQQAAMEGLLKVLFETMNEAKALNHPQARPEHLLLAILRQGPDGPAKALVDLGLNLDEARAAIIRALTDRDSG